MKLNTRSEEPPPRGVLDVDVSDSSSVSGTSSGCSSATTDKEKAEKAGHVAAAVAATTAFNTMTYGSVVKDFVDNLKQKSGVRKLSNTTISMLTSCDLSTTSIHQKLACTWSADDDIDCSLVGKRWKNFTYSELVAATNDSSPDRLVGKGGNTDVFKGCLPDGTVTALKKLTKKGEKKEERTVDFLSELGIITHVEHRNTAKLFGF